MTKKNYRKLACAVALATSFASLPGVSSAEEGNEPETAVTAQAGEAAAQQSPETVTAQDAENVASQNAEAAPQGDADTAAAQDGEAAARQSDEAAQDAAAPQDASEATLQQAAGDEAGKVAADAGNDRIRDWAKLRPTEEAIEAYKKKYEGKTIVDIELDGATDATRATAEKAGKLHAGDKYTAAGLDEDMAALLDTGYYYDLFPSFEEVPEGVVLTYHLLENPVLKSLKITGNTVEKTEDLLALVPLRTGELLNSVELRRDVQRIQERYRADGYILAKITDLNIDKAGNLTIKINEGTIEGFKVKGNKKTKDYVILREMRQKVGEPFNAKKTQRSWQRVNNLGFFEEVTPKIVPGVNPNAVVVEWDVKEKRTGTFSVGAGYSSQDGVIGMLSVGDTNFRGTGDAVSITYEVSGDDTDAHGYSVSYRHPWIDQKQTVGTIRVYNRTYEYDDYNDDGDYIESYMRKYSGGEITLGRPVSEYSTNYITLRNRKDKYCRLTGIGNEEHGAYDSAQHKAWVDYNFGLTRSLTLSHVTDTRDNIYFPTTGGRVSLTGEIGGFGGDFSYRKADVEDQRYFKAGHAQVWALRGQYGWGSGHLSEFSRYKVGGQDSLRGYRDDQFRGERMFLATLEYRFPIVSKVQGALFTDWGGAWDDGLWPDEVKGSVGIGMSLTTPMGPIRLDYGRGSDGGRIHFSVGGTF